MNERNVVDAREELSTLLVMGEGGAGGTGGVGGG